MAAALTYTRSHPMPQQRPPGFTYRKNVLHAERLSIAALANRFGTPLYIYSADAIERRYRIFDAAFKRRTHSICYSVKANPNLSVLKMLAGLGAGFDIVSGGELERVRTAARKSLRKIVFSGVGKQAAEIDAALRADILIFNVESAAELELLAERSQRLKKRARIALRVNPDVPATTHPYISTGLRQHKFGIEIGRARELYAHAATKKSLHVAGVSVHIGSQILEVAPFAEALSRVAELVRTLQRDGHDIRYVDAGGGLGVDYSREERLEEFAVRAGAYAEAIDQALGELSVHLLLEPGRSIMASAGILVAKVLYSKHNSGKEFLITDAAMNDLIRPALYSAHHEIVPVEIKKRMPMVADVVGPVCESGDFFARDRALESVAPGDLLAILDAGAYGMSLSSNYNSRPRAAEVMVSANKARVIRKRESVADLIRQER